ncbi:MAG: molybdate ABC transporter substrate-binding protein [Steroidobacteraceae bacterium]|nr:molybdate ABC transporter substrate-binding protein [Steroidobacteraceae bacterium]MDW8258213.1 molybdate ABC transporter substrate-binding protein [Gammaproteobacteria bacterium]
MRLPFFRVAALWCLASIGAGAAVAQPLTIAAAADLKFAMDELVAAFDKEYPGPPVQVTYGSSGNFFAQIRNGAPYDLYFSADLDYPRRLAQVGQALDDNVFRYAVGRIVVWAPKSSAVDVRRLRMQALLGPSVKKIAIANPQHAPYGRAAVAAMQAFDVYEHCRTRLVYGENIAQTAQFVQSGAADLGIIALSLAVAPPLRDAGVFWEIPAESYPRLEQGGLIVRETRVPERARAFRDFVLGERGRAILQRYGFLLPGS